MSFQTILNFPSLSRYGIDLDTPKRKLVEKVSNHLHLQPVENDER
jgi:hypothetical protein